MDSAPLSDVDSVPLKAVDSVPLSNVDSVPLKAVDSVPLSNVYSVPLKAVDSVPLKAVDSLPEPAPSLNTNTAIQKAPAMKYRRRAKHLLADPMAKHFSAVVLPKEDVYALTW